MSTCINEDINEPQLLLVPRCTDVQYTPATSCSPVLTLKVPDVTACKGHVIDYFKDKESVMDGSAPGSFLCCDPDGTFVEVL